MSETKFTPGPWHLCAHLKNINEEIGCSCGYRGVIYGPEDMGLAICQPGHEPDGMGLEPPRYDRMTEIANAHLIAAAPELYEALEWLETYAMVQVDRHPDAQDNKGWRNIIAALAKARGETQA